MYEQGGLTVSDRLSSRSEFVLVLHVEHGLVLSYLAKQGSQISTEKVLFIATACAWQTESGKIDNHCSLPNW